MDTERLILTILGFFGLIFILVIIYYFLARWMEQPSTKDKQVAWPPASYMEATGAQCPDYWNNAGNVGEGEHRCVNKFNLPVIKVDSKRCKNVDCLDDGNSKNFKTIAKWPVKNRNEIKDRCLWRDCCVTDKLNKNVPASWIGIDSVCNS
jgi:hypothetical protein